MDTKDSSKAGTDQKSAAISARILAFIANGATVRDAFEWVLGPGYYDCLASEVYDELRAKAVQS